MDQTRRQRLMEEVASRLRAERARLNLTLADAAIRSGVNYVSISRYEQSVHLITLDALYALADAYGIDPVALLPPAACLADLPKGKQSKKGKS